MEHDFFSQLFGTQKHTDEELNSPGYHYVSSNIGRESIYDRRYSNKDEDEWIEPEIEKPTYSAEDIKKLKKTHWIMYVFSILLCFTCSAVFGFISLIYCLKTDTYLKRQQYEDVEKCNKTSTVLCILGVVFIIVTLFIVGGGILYIATHPQILEYQLQKHF